MKKQSKDLGITGACPHCKRTLFRDMCIDGEGSIVLKCPNKECFKKVPVILIKKTVVKILIFILIICGIFHVYEKSKIEFANIEWPE